MLSTLYKPSSYVGGIPCDSPVPLTQKDLTVYGVIKPGTQVDGSGMLIWNVLRGCYSMALCSLPTTMNLSGSNGLINDGLFVVTSVFPVPYVNSNTMLSLKPELSLTMSKGRLSAGKVCIYSSTTSTTLAALNGELAGATVTDLRNCGDFTVPSIMQASSTVKDSVCNVRPNWGVATVVGCDVAPDVHMINYDKGYVPGESGIIHGVMTSSVFAPLINGNAGFATFDPFGCNPGYYSSPYGAFSFGVGEHVPMGVNIKARCGLTVGDIAAGTFGTFRICARVFKSTCGLNGVTNNPTVETYVLTEFYFATGANGTYFFESPLIRCAFDEIITAVVFFLTNVTAQPLQLPGVSFSPGIYVENVYGPTGFGSFRVLRWDNIDSTQTINIKGTLMVDGVPTGSIAPFVKGSPNAGASTSSTVLTALRRLFFDPSVFTRRVYPANEESSNYSNEAGTALNRYMAAGMYASGMYAGGFSSIGKDLGGAIGDVAGTGLSLLGSTLDDVFSAAGSVHKRPRLDL